MPTPNRDQIERITRRQVFQRPHDAGLNYGFGEHGGDGVGEAFEAIDDGEHDILSAAVPDLVHDTQPELGAFILLDPHAEHFLAAIGAHAQRNVDRLGADHALVADLDPDRIEEDERIGGIEQALLPGGNFLDHGIGDGRYQIRRDVDAIKLPQMPVISRVLMPRAYIEIILSSKPGKRRWYLAINCGSKLPCRSRGTSMSILPVSVTTVLRP
jgi:hypothetical protein